MRLVLAAALFGVVALMGPTPARAAAFQDSSYVRVVVPDMGQAVAFFRDVLGCPLISPVVNATDSRIDGRASALLTCGSGSVVELSLAMPSRRQQQGALLQLASDDVAGATQWLRHQGVEISGPPQRLSSGQLAVNLVTPWGQSLQLVGWPADVASARR